MRSIFCLFFVLLAGVCSGAESSARPNILYIFADDMGWGSIGPNGQAARKARGLPYVRTPNIDRLAAAGVNFTRAYACHVCSPSRSSQQSGFHQGHTFADNNDPNNARKAMRADDILMGDVLSGAGYVTGYWGKWGYGGSKDRVNPTIDNVQTLPTSHGYQHVLAELHHVRAHTFFQPTLWQAPAKPGAMGGIELVPNSLANYRNKPAYPNTPAGQNHPDYPATAYCDDAYAFAALDFVRTNALNVNKTGQPFFGLLAIQIPHAPFGEITQLPDWNAAYQDDPKFAELPPQAQQWAAMVTRMDAHLGNLLAALDDPNNDGDTADSVADNTLVIFQSDNGGPGGSNNGVFDSNGGLRGTKGKIQEGGIRVPLVMRWPAQVHADSNSKAGTSSDRVVDITDLLPTFCDLAGASTPLGLDGVSIAPTLLGKGHQRQRDFIIHQASNGQSIIRGKHKLVRVRMKKSKDTPIELYDLETDHAEEDNIADAHPELVKELEALLLGERVTEPKGFANTYHHWIGGNDAVTSNAKHWSDYAYTNAGITYLADDGAPQRSWTARMENSNTTPSVARADADLEFLGLEIRGGSSSVTQTLALGPGVNLTGRNEIRLSGHSNLAVNGGTVASLRWIDVLADSTLSGHGTISAIVYQHGTIKVEETLTINADYYASATAKLALAIANNESVPMEIRGNAYLSGTLEVISASDASWRSGTSFKVLTAKKIGGRFGNSEGLVVDKQGNRFTVGYSDSAVTLTVL